MTGPGPLTEIRSFAEYRASGRRLEGYAARFGVEARIGNFIETILPGAFKASLADGRDIIGLVDHDRSKVLARTRSGTLKLQEDSQGLAFDLSLPQTQTASDLLALAERGDLGGMSFAFTVPKDGERWTGNRRELRSVNLVEISIVSAWPAYPETSVIARAKTPRLNLARLFLETIRPWDY
jgi:HK97 family phage prohead protease